MYNVCTGKNSKLTIITSSLPCSIWFDNLYSLCWRDIKAIKTSFLYSITVTVWLTSLNCKLRCVHASESSTRRRPSNVDTWEALSHCCNFWTLNLLNLILYWIKLIFLSVLFCQVSNIIFSNKNFPPVSKESRKETSIQIILDTAFTT